MASCGSSTNRLRLLCQKLLIRSSRTNYTCTTPTYKYIVTTTTNRPTAATIAEIGRFRPTFTTTRMMSNMSASSGNGLIGGNGQKKVAIFDKDGTLVCMHALWAPWMEQTAKRLEDAAGFVLADEIYSNMGYDPETKTFGPGLVSECTQEACFDYLRNLLESKGIEPDSAQEITANCFRDDSALSVGEVKAFGDVLEIFQRLKNVGYHIAVNSSDSRVTVEGVLVKLGVMDLLDAVLCGDDADTIPKPDPYTVNKICSQLGAEPKNSVFIGDTPTDVWCGRNSNCGLVISVLSGGVDRALLEPKSDHVVESITEATEIILQQTSPN